MFLSSHGWFVINSLVITQIKRYHNVLLDDQGTEDVYDGRNTKKARRTCPREIWNTAQRKLDILDSAESLDDLRALPANRLEKLSGRRAGQYSIRINDQYRICFHWSESGPTRVEITDYH